MAEKKKPKRNGGRHCVAGAPNIKAVRTSATRQASRLNFLREMGQICATAPSRFQGADFKACLIVFGAFRAKLLRK